MSSVGSSFPILWKYILNKSFITASDNEFSVWWKRYSFIHIFWNHYCNYRGVNIYKSLISASGNRFLHFFSETDSNGSSFLFQWNRFFLANPSFWVMKTDFRLTKNHMLLFRVFICWWVLFLKLGVYQFSSIVSIPNSGSSFFG